MIKDEYLTNKSNTAEYLSPSAILSLPVMFPYPSRLLVEHYETRSSTNPVSVSQLWRYPSKDQAQFSMRPS